MATGEAESETSKLDANVLVLFVPSESRFPVLVYFTVGVVVCPVSFAYAVTDN